MKNNIVKDKSFDLALRIVNLHRILVNEKKEFVLSKQLLRAGTSIGANVREAVQAESKADFIHKFSISLKQANECEYWLELLFKSDYIDENQFNSFNKDLKEILKLLTSIINTSKRN